MSICSLQCVWYFSFLLIYQVPHPINNLQQPGRSISFPPQRALSSLPIDLQIHPLRYGDWTRQWPFFSGVSVLTVPQRMDPWIPRVDTLPETLTKASSKSVFLYQPVVFSVHEISLPGRVYTTHIYIYIILIIYIYKYSKYTHTCGHLRDRF